MNCRRVFDNAVAEQGPILHQTKHTDAPPSVFRTGVSRTGVSRDVSVFPYVKELP
jgi:hypothetical protein